MIVGTLYKKNNIMIKTNKKIFTEKTAAKDVPENYKYIEFTGITISTDDETQKVLFRFTEMSFRLEEAQRQVMVEGLPQFNADSTKKMETYQKQIDKVFVQNSEDFTYDAFFAIREQIRAQLPDGLTPAQEYKMINNQGLISLIVTGGYYRNQFTLENFEIL